MAGSRAPESRLLHPARGGPGAVIAFEPYRRRLEEFRRHAEDEVEWDRLRRLIDEACTWRDPESLSAVEHCIARLREMVRSDWEPE